MPKESATLHYWILQKRNNIFAAVNKPTSFLKEKLLFLKKEITLILGSKPQPRNKNAACHHFVLLLLLLLSLLLIFFLNCTLSESYSAFYSIF